MALVHVPGITHLKSAVRAFVVTKDNQIFYIALIQQEQCQLSRVVSEPSIRVGLCCGVVLRKTLLSLVPIVYEVITVTIGVQAKQLYSEQAVQPVRNTYHVDATQNFLPVLSLRLLWPSYSLHPAKRSGF